MKFTRQLGFILLGVFLIIRGLEIAGWFSDIPAIITGIVAIISGILLIIKN